MENYHGILNLTLKRTNFFATVMKQYRSNLLSFESNFHGNIVFITQTDKIQGSLTEMEGSLQLTSLS